MIFFFVVTGCQAQVQAGDPYTTFSAFNDIEITYAVFLPADYDPSTEYSAALAFPSGDMGREAADEMTEHLWGTPAARSGWIVVVPLVPGDDWRTHPNHHALNDLLEHIDEEYPIRSGKFHIVGYGRLGSDVASTWSNMSREHFLSLTTASGAPYRQWDDGDIRRLPVRDGERLDLLVVWGGLDSETATDVETAKSRMGSIGHPMMSEQIARDDAVLASLANGGLLRLMKGKMLQP